MKKQTLALSLLVAISLFNLTAHAATSGASGLISAQHINTLTEAKVTGFSSQNPGPVALIQPMLMAPSKIVGKVSVMGSPINTIQPMLDAPILTN